ncbi:uncharacterized protein UMAG_11900 [Mycosarcoma maydis]|uniref:Uncharacterized protein n=1 Tax=Mycosarcoma maydis TaxID=5270 RepID=A0A0D1CBQ0_MYCMD|nr:uncharacterized protein UMAG_11900 [Ustilago maydis 521]KIS70642.1 hypothetical protein UMAG_11900 [Ustilago maydis 521]|eukprot:XP_011388116.1 hypothetical protein UMAG_11900 [Ustilago maydis 521]
MSHSKRDQIGPCFLPTDVEVHFFLSAATILRDESQRSGNAENAKQDSSSCRAVPSCRTQFWFMVQLSSLCHTTTCFHLNRM